MARRARVLLIGEGGDTSVLGFFARAARELGHSCDVVDERVHCGGIDTSLFHKIVFRLRGRRPLGRGRFNRAIARTARRASPDLTIVVKGRFVAPGSLEAIRAASDGPIVNYATDDPFNRRNQTPDMLDGIPSYDLIASTKTAIMADLERAGARDVAYVPFAYDPEHHFPEAPANSADRAAYDSDVTFIGGADPDRFRLLASLAETSGLRLRLFGGYWDRHEPLGEYHQGFARGREYRLAIGGARISLGLVRRANRDGHAMRSFEIPACGGFMLAERTDEHLELFQEGRDAAFFDSVEEMRSKVDYYLAHESERRRIAARGRDRIRSGGHTYRDRLEALIAAVGAAA